jgi:hypothetical protein
MPPPGSTDDFDDDGATLQGRRRIAAYLSGRDEAETIHERVPLDPAKDFADEAEIAHRERMKEVRAYLRARGRERGAFLAARCTLLSFPLAAVALVAGAAWFPLPGALVAAWIALLPILFVTSVVAGLWLIQRHGTRTDGVWPFAAGYVAGRRRH